MTSLRDAYAEALIERLKQHTGPLGDLAPVLERLDVLTGVDIEQKQLTAGTPRVQGSTPAIEHGFSPLSDEPVPQPSRRGASHAGSRL